MKINELTPAIADKMVNEANELYYYRHSLHGVGTTYENWQECHKTVVEKAGFDYDQYNKWCMANLSTPDDDDFLI